MDTALILQSLDREIGNLQQARRILAGKPVQRRLPIHYNPDSARLPRGGGSTFKPKRVMSPEGRKAIAAGQKKRWAKQKAA